MAGLAVVAALVHVLARLGEKGLKFSTREPLRLRVAGGNTLQGYLPVVGGLFLMSEVPLYVLPGRDLVSNALTIGW